MFCEKCKNELDSSAKFCPYCGAVFTANTSQPAPAADPAPGPYGNTGAPGLDPNTQRPKSHGWIKILIGASAAVLAVVLAVVLIVNGVFNSDKNMVLKAAAKSISAYSDAAKEAGLPDWKALIEGQEFGQSIEIALEDADLGWYGYFFDISALKGTGIRVSTNYDLSGEKFSASATPFFGSADLLTAELVMDGSRVYVGSPELIGGTCYGLDTMTLGRDLQKLGADQDMVGDLSFNIFQLAKKVQEAAEPDSESRNTMKDACKKLYQAIEVKKTGTETVKVNGGSVMCDAYAVVIPADAIKDYFRAVKDIVSGIMDGNKDLISLLSSLGLSDKMMEKIEDRLSGTGLNQTFKDKFDSLEGAADVLGGVELQVHISDGYVMTVSYSGRIEDVRVKLKLCLGGGENYVDDLSLTVSAGGSESQVEATLTSHGSHGAANGTFTDETVLEITAYGGTTEISSEISYASNESQNNLSWRIGFEGYRVDMEGRLATGQDSLDLHLEKLEFRAGDMSVTVRADYSIGACQSIPTVSSPVMISALNQDDLLNIADEIRDNAFGLARDLLKKIPLLKFIF